MGLAASINNESKPIWLCVQAFEGSKWLMPTPREMRAQVYTALIHGATGIIYFAMDSCKYTGNTHHALDFQG